MGIDLDEVSQDPFEPIAIIGVGAILPDARDADAFWRNVLDAKVSIREVPDDRWSVDDFWSEGGPGNVEENRTYSRIGAFVAGFEFDWKRWRVPPGTLAQIDVCQQWAVEVSAAALEDAGYLGEDSSRELPRARTGVVFANALGGENRNLSNHRVWASRFSRLAVEEGGMPESGRGALEASIAEGAPKVDEDTMPGELANVVAGRVANLLDLQGPNYTTDAACATTFAAVLDACRLLQARQVDVMLAGAADRTMDPATYAKFSAIGALSPSHSTPFDARADGFVMGEGAGCVVLKRLGDALDDGDRIYAVVRGVGASSDGRGKGITAPSTRGQVQAVSRAHMQAGYGPDSVELIEAHGTSTIVGDATELESLGTVFEGSGRGPDEVAVGSIKSQIGHLKAAAGMAGLLKAMFALHHRTLPPSAGFETPNENVDWNSVPFFVPCEAREWPAPASGTPRRAGISAFGFGGTNFHCALEQFDPEHHADLAKEWSQRRARWLDASPAGESDAVQAGQGAASVTMTHSELLAVEGGVLLLNAADLDGLVISAAAVRASLLDGSPTFDDDPRGRRLSEALPAASTDYEATGARLAIVATSWAELEKRFDLFEKAAEDRGKWDFLSKQNVFVSDGEPLPEGAKVAHMFPGQGSQYVGMTYDLSKRYSIIGETWEEADRTMVDILDGETLSSFVLRRGLTEEEMEEAEECLKQTEYTQPAMLTADLAIERLLEQHALHPDMVAGHSLGEYAALMVSGILGFHDALRAAAARGTEMGSVEVPDRGVMASVTAPVEIIEEVLEEAEGYVIAANRNSPMMTVIAGETEPMESVMETFVESGATVVRLQTSHAFHSRIVAPANEPLRRFLDNLDISLPSIPITANVDGSFYPDSVGKGTDPKAAILEKLAPQMSSPVQWTDQIRTMHDSGARFFLEVGPKRALALFVDQILEDEERVVSITNHPKAGGIQSFLAATAALAVAGRPSRNIFLDSEIHTPAFRAGPMEAAAATESAEFPPESSAANEALRVRARPLPSAGDGSSTPQAQFIDSTSSSSNRTAGGETPSSEMVERAMKLAAEALVSDIVSDVSGYPKQALSGAIHLEEVLRIDASSQTSIRNRIRAAAIVAEVDERALQTVGDLVDWIVDLPSSTASIGPERGVPCSVSSPPSGVRLGGGAPPVVSGVSLGLPGMEEVFAPDALDRILAGQNFISEIPESLKQRLLELQIVRLVKSDDGTASFVAADTVDKVPQLAGRGGAFDLAEQYGIDSKLVDAFDVATSLSFAAGLEALRDAGLPLLPVEQVNSQGKRMVRGWRLPDSERDRTGVIFASVFPGLQMAVRHALADGRSKEGHFDRKYLLQVLSMGHSQFAAWIGARGPNLAINNACASTPAAFAVAEDWMAQGRCDRVIIVSGDDSTGDDLMPWVGAGFAAAGAHAMGDVVEEVALPFDARRHGMLLGMGGAAFVLERANDASERGVVPYVEVLGAEIANSAFHPTRLDTGHAAEVMERFVARMEARWSLDRGSLADRMTFMSHEPYTPPRGGSAAAEVEALRHVFGEDASRILITNAKGFVGHPMGVGLEDAVVIRGLAEGVLPPIANFRDVDDSLGPLNLSKGGKHELEYALRHGAGFGSQIALTFLRRIARSGTARFRPDRIRLWTERAAGNSIEIRVLDRKLVAWVDADERLIGGVQGEIWNPQEAEETATPSSLTIEPPAKSEVRVTAPTDPEGDAGEDGGEMLPTSVKEQRPDAGGLIEMGGDSIQDGVMQVVSSATGYPSEFLELDADMEGELGIDSIKQAEIMSELRDCFSLPVDEEFQLREHPTLGHVITYIASFSDGGHAVRVEPASAEEEPTSNPEEDEAAAEPEYGQMSEPTGMLAAIDGGAVHDAVIEVVCTHTGYPAEFLELDADMEGELGIDSIKQAEIMGDLRERFGIPVDEDFQLREHPTLGHVIRYISSFNGSRVAESSSQSVNGNLSLDDATPTSDGPELVDEIESEPEADPELVRTTDSGSPKGPSRVDGVKRYQVEVDEAPLGPIEELDLTGSFVLVTDDAWGVAEHLCSLLEDRGIDAIRVFFDGSVSGGIRVERDGEVDIVRCNPGSSDQITAAVEHVHDLGEIGGIIHLAPLRLAGTPWASETTEAHLEFSITGLFSLLQGVDASVSSRDAALVASVSALDGRHGVQSERFNSLAAGAHGIVKSYSREREGVRCRALDLDPELLGETETLAEMLLTELLEQAGPREVGIEADGSRWRLCLFDERLELPREPLLADDVWVVSGGAAGVTAECIVATAEASAGAGAAFVLMGRTSLDPSLSDLVDADEETLEEARKKLRQRMQEEAEEAAAEGEDPPKVTLVEWDREWRSMQRGAEVHRTIRRIAATGNRVLYRAVDVTNANAVREAVDDVRSILGSITGIVHGAGIEDSTRFEEKELDTVERVLSVKVRGWDAMFSAVTPNLKELRFAAVFTSIAGRTGNAMQCDYCAANQILDVEMARLSAQDGDFRAVAIAWSPWADVGMATRGSLDRVFKAAGIEMIPPDEGAERFVDEALRGGKRMSVVAGAIGDLDDEDCTRAAPQRLPPDVAQRLANPSRFPFIEIITNLDPFDDITAECTLTVERFPFLADHAINDVPYMPGVMCLEAFAESALLLWPICSLSGFEKVVFGLPLKVMRSSQMVRIRASFAEQDAHHVWIDCSMETDLVNSKGEVFGEPKVHHSATVRLLKSGAVPGAPAHPILGWPSDGTPLHSSEFVYQRMFHGPRFQVHGGVIHAFDREGRRGCDGIALTRDQLPDRVQFSEESIGEVVLLEANPMLIESVFQNAGLIAMEVDGLESLPIGIGNVRIERIPEEDEQLRVRTVRRAADEGGVTVHDGIVYDSDGDPVISLEGLRLKGIAPLPDDLSFRLSGD